jgi:hypothetical protein
MKKYWFLLLMLPCLSVAQSGEFKGADEINTILLDRVVESSEQPLLSMLFQFQEPPYDLLPLLGTYDGSIIGNGAIKNGTPNAFNMILWDVLIGNLSLRLSQECNSKVFFVGKVLIQKNILSHLSVLCQWPIPASKDIQLYQSLFDDISMFDVPQSEFDLWYYHYVASGQYDKETPEQYIRELMYALFMNPYFLLQR